MLMKLAQNSNEWRKFSGALWKHQIDVRDFIQRNYTPYDGDSSFLAPPTERTEKVRAKAGRYFELEALSGGVLDIDTSTVSSLLSYDPGYLDLSLIHISEPTRPY